MSLSFVDKSPYPFFIVTNSAQQIVNATDTTIIFNRLATGSIDPGSNVSTGGVYTAPVKGLYCFSVTLCVGGPGASVKGNNTIRYGFVSSAAGTTIRHVFAIDNFARFSATDSYYSRNISGVFFMNVGDTISVSIVGVASATPLVFNPGLSWFSGHLITAFS